MPLTGVARDTTAATTSCRNRVPSPNHLLPLQLPLGGDPVWSGFGRMRTLWIMAVLLVGVEGGLWQFENMIIKVVKKSGILSYSAYGCYCGWGGRGKPKDATDRCCFVHDCCYGKVTGCNPKLGKYTYSWNNGDIVCEGDGPCKEVCECDRAAAICFRDNLDTYDRNKYWRYPASNCQEDSEPC